jgi:hypothetical protein
MFRFCFSSNPKKIPRKSEAQKKHHFHVPAENSREKMKRKKFLATEAREIYAEVPLKWSGKKASHTALERRKMFAQVLDASESVFTSYLAHERLCQCREAMQDASF